MTHIRRIREKIEANPSQPVSLITIKGLGLLLVRQIMDAHNGEIQIRRSESGGFEVELRLPNL